MSYLSTIYGQCHTLVQYMGSIYSNLCITNVITLTISYWRVSNQVKIWTRLCVTQCFKRRALSITEGRIRDYDFEFLNFVSIGFTFSQQMSSRDLYNGLFVCKPRNYGDNSIKRMRYFCTFAFWFRLFASPNKVTVAFIINSGSVLSSV